MSVLKKITKYAQMFIEPEYQTEYIEKSHLEAHIRGTCNCGIDNKELHVKYHLENCCGYINNDPTKTPLPLSCSCRIDRTIPEDEIIELIEKHLKRNEEEMKDKPTPSQIEIDFEFSIHGTKSMCRCCRKRGEKGEEKRCCQKKNSINTKTIDDLVAYIEGN